MHGSLKLLFAVLIYIAFSSSPVIAQDDFLQNIIEKRNKPKQMQSITVSTPKNEADESSDVAGDGDQEDKKDKQIWENYKKTSTEDLTGNNKGDSPAENEPIEKVTDSSSTNEDASTVDNNIEKEEQQPEEKGELIKGVLEEYKKTNNENSTIGKRSFGDIGW